MKADQRSIEFFAGAGVTRRWQISSERSTAAKTSWMSSRYCGYKSHSIATGCESESSKCSDVAISASLFGTNWLQK